jgi:hypothetical protein
MVQAVSNGAVIAKSDKTVVAEGNRHFPCESRRLRRTPLHQQDHVAFWTGSEVSRPGLGPR